MRPLSSAPDPSGRQCSTTTEAQRLASCSPSFARHWSNAGQSVTNGSERKDWRTKRASRTETKSRPTSFLSWAGGEKETKQKKPLSHSCRKAYYSGNYNHLILLCSSIKMEISPKSPISFGRTNMLFGFAYFINLKSATIIQYTIKGRFMNR